MNYARKIFLISLLAVISCSKAVDTNGEFYDFLKETTTKNVLLDHANVVVIPNAGCGGCIMNSERFMFENIDSLENTFFILTAFNSIKELRAKYSPINPKLLSNDKIILDVKGNFNKLSIDKIYPIVIFIRNGSITEVAALDPDNEQLLNRIKRPDDIQDPI